MAHPWKSSGSKRTVWWYYSPSDNILLYLRDMREATRYGVIDIPTNNIVSIQNDFSRRRRKLQKHIKNPQKRKKKLKQTRCCTLNCSVVAVRIYNKQCYRSFTLR